MLITWRKNEETASGKYRRGAKGERTSEDSRPSLFLEIARERERERRKLKLARGIKGKGMWKGRKKGEKESGVKKMSLARVEGRVFV